MPAPPSAHPPGAAPRFASWQLTLLPGLVVATLVVSAWLLMHQQLRQQTRQQVSAQTAHRARLVAQHLALNLDQRVRQVEQLARDRALQPGEPLAGQQALLDLVVRGSAGIAWIGLLEPDGRVRAGSDRLLEGQSLAARPVYQQGRERLFVDGLHRSVMLADLLHPAQGGDLTLADVSLPLRNAHGQTAAVLAVHLDGAWFEQLVQQTLADTDAGSGLRVVVLGGDGKPALGDRSAWGPAWRRIALPAPGAAAAQVQLAGPAGDGGAWTSEWAVARAALPARPGRPTLDWQVVVWQSLDQAGAPQRQFLRAVALGGAALVLLFGLIGHLLARRVLRPYLGVFDRLAADPRLADGRDHAPGLTARLDALLRDTLDPATGRSEDAPGARMLRRIGTDIARLRELLDSLPVAVMLQDDAGRWHYLNPLAARWLGQPLAALIGQTPDAPGLALAPDWQAALRPGPADASGWLERPADPSEVAALLPARDPSPRTLRWSRQRLGDAPGTGHGHGKGKGTGNGIPGSRDDATPPEPGASAAAQTWLTVLIDQSAEARARRQSALTAAAFDQQMALAIADAHGRLLQVNASFGALLDHDPAWLVGQPLADFEVDAPGLTAHAGRAAALSASGRWAGAARLRRRDGTALAVWYQVSRVAGSEHDSPHGAADVVSVFDLSERQRAEQALRDSQAELSALARRLIDQEHTVSRRIAQALHDQLGQTLTAAALQVDLLKAATPADPAHSAPLHQTLERLLRQASVQVRQILIDLRPPLVEAHGLAAALDNEQRLWHPSAARQGTHLILQIEPAVAALRWPAEVEYAAFMIAREAIVNALRHARCATIACEVDGDASHLRLTVRDDGLGFREAPGLGEGPDASERPSAIRAGHLGLVGMRERALAIGARCEVQTHPGEGTRVELRWSARVATAAITAQAAPS